jgi:outer membrane protein TolC
LVYSDKVWANYPIEQLGQTAREQGRNAVELDVVQAASIAYLDVLKAKRIERIQKENLKLTRKNLERAQIRVSIGAAGPEEVYRWESQLAESRRQVLIAESVSLNTISTVNRRRAWRFRRNCNN